MTDTPWPMWAVVVLAAVVVVVAVDRVLLAIEARGIIYYRKRRASPGTAASALLEVQSHLRPAIRHEVDQRREVHTEEDEAGEQVIPAVEPQEDKTQPL